mmetsp:Transcript_25800/g.64807  ORF Transcript_25800/g.64807 Transcript_25800/m.64807 type:complete len:115 (+) Transcript_25800:96-440(+)
MTAPRATAATVVARILRMTVVWSWAITRPHHTRRATDEEKQKEEQEEEQEEEQAGHLPHSNINNFSNIVRSSCHTVHNRRTLSNANRSVQPLSLVPRPPDKPEKQRPRCRPGVA